MPRESNPVPAFGGTGVFRRAGRLGRASWTPRSGQRRADAGGVQDSATVDSLFTFAGQVLAALGGAPIVPDSSLIPAPTTIDCSVQDAVTVPEVVNLFASISAFNDAIEAEADARGWVFIDPNDLLLQLAADTSAIRPFPAFPGTASSGATLNTPFGSAISLDAVHPSASTHRLLANALIPAINAAYETSLAAVP